jgi:multidrug efflux system membrane fusion protein
MRTRLLIGVALAVGAAGIAGPLLMNRDRSAAATPPAALSVPVALTKVAKTDVPIELDGLGRVQAFNTVTVRTQVEGQIQRIAYKQGQVVEQGDLLVKIDPRLYQAKLEQDQATLARDKAQVASAQANLSRHAPSAKSGYATAQVDTQTAMVVQAQATLKADQAVIDDDQLKVDDTTITAPISGVTGFRGVDQGNVVHPTDTNGLVTITQVQPIAALFTLPQASLPDIQARRGETGNSALTVEAWSQDGKVRLDVGTLETVNNQVDAASGTITLRADFPNEMKLLWPGEFAEIRLILATQHDALTVPAPAIQRGAGGTDGTFVWVVHPDGTATPQPVDVKQMIHGTALVGSGLTAGETVVTDGQDGLKSGDHVADASPADPNKTAALRNGQTDRLGIQR